KTLLEMPPEPLSHGRSPIRPTSSYNQMYNHIEVDAMTHDKKSLMALLLEQLDRRGKNSHAEVRTTAGVADIVTKTAVYAVVPDLTPKSLTEATDQVIAYRDALGEGRRAVIYGRPAPEDQTLLDDAIEAAKNRGVTVNVVKDGNLPGTT